MPNQLARSKRRQSLAEHEAVLAALALIARREKTSVMALLREAARALIRQRAAETDPAPLRDVVWSKAPRVPARFKSAAQVARFKRAQREFDRVVLDLGLAPSAAVQARNSIASPATPIRIPELDRAHATTAR